MAVTVSGLYVANFVDVLDASQLAIDTSLTTHKLALFNNSLTPDFTNDTAFSSSPFTSNQVSGTGWASGGIALSALASGSTSAAPTTTGSGGDLIYDHTNDTSVASTTLTNARCAVIYADALTTPTAKPAIVLINFGADYSTNNGIFGIVWNASGIFRIDLTP